MTAITVAVVVVALKGATEMTTAVIRVFVTAAVVPREAVPAVVLVLVNMTHALPLLLDARDRVRRRVAAVIAVATTVVLTAIHAAVVAGNATDIATDIATAAAAAAAAVAIVVGGDLGLIFFYFCVLCFVMCCHYL